MLYNQRAEFVLQQLQLQSTVKVSDLSRQLHISVDTVRRDLKAMEQQGLIVSHIDIADNENMGKRVFSITPAGLECMMHWKETLEDYQKGIDEIIEGIAEAAGKRKLD